MRQKRLENLPLYKEKVAEGSRLDYTDWEEIHDSAEYGPDDVFAARGREILVEALKEDLPELSKRLHEHANLTPLERQLIDVLADVLCERNGEDGTELVI